VSSPGLTASEVVEAWVEVAEAGLRFWGRLGRLAFESVSAIATERRNDVTPAAAVAAAARVEAPTPPAEHTILVEAEAGQSGRAVFLVENRTPEPVSVSVEVSPFVDGKGREVRPQIAFRPEVITLDPGEQTVVEAAVAVDQTLKAGIRYRADMSVPALPGTTIPIVVRRRAKKRQAKAQPKAA
jgi:hypothetical protein